MFCFLLALLMMCWDHLIILNHFFMLISFLMALEKIAHLVWIDIYYRLICFLFTLALPAAVLAWTTIMLYNLYKIFYVYCIDFINFNRLTWRNINLAKSYTCYLHKSQVNWFLVFQFHTCISTERQTERHCVFWYVSIMQSRCSEYFSI